MAINRDQMARLTAGIKAFGKEDYFRAFEFLHTLAQEGNPRAQCYIATMYQGGFGVPVNGVKAVDWYSKAAMQNDMTERVSAVAYHNLGMIYIAGMPGVARDTKLAKSYWRKAAQLGSELIPKEWYDESEE